MTFKSPLFATLIVLFLIIIKGYGGYLQITLTEDPYLNKHLIKILINGLLSIAFMLLISKSHFKERVGLTGASFLRLDLLVLPLFYGVLINLLFLDFEGNLMLQYISILFLSTLSVGFVEELSLRGLIQNYLIDYFGQHKKGIVKAIVSMSFLFAALHLLNLDKGPWGEMAQFFYAFFIAMGFGTVFYFTQRIYPLIIIHGLIDFAGGIDRLGIVNYQSSTDNLMNSLFIILLLSPYLFYALYLLKKT